MKNYIHAIFGIMLIGLPMMVRAEKIYTEHTFRTMNKETELLFYSSNTIAWTNLLTYRCTGNADTKFDKDHIYKTNISIRLPKNGSTVTTSKINELEEFIIGVITNSDVYDCTNLKVKVSKDSVNWGSLPITSSDSITYTASSIQVTLPRNNYYVRLYNTNSSKDISITSIFWYQDHCNCFIYEAE